MRIVHIADRFYSQAGYLINILTKYEVKDGHKVFVISSAPAIWDDEKRQFWDAGHAIERDHKFFDKYGVKVIRYPARRVVATRVIYKRGIFSFVNRIKPDVLFIHSESSYCAIMYMLKINRNNFPIVLGSHMMDIAARRPLKELFYVAYRTVFARIIKKHNIFMIRTQDDDYAIRRLGVPESNAPLISFGSDIEIFHPDSKKRAEIRRKYDIKEDAFVVIVTGKLNKDKGGLIVAKAFEKKFMTQKDVVLITIGTITDDHYAQEVDNIFNRSENRVIRIPTQDYENLAQYYQCADLSIFAKECSLSFYDAQACGLPVVLEDNELNIMRVNHGNGKVYRRNDIESFISRINEFINMPLDEYKEFSDNARSLIAAKYNYKDISSEYTKILENSVRRFRMNGRI